MAQTVEAPVVGAELDPDDPSGSVVSIIMAVVGVLLAGGVVAAALAVWNMLAERTPEEIPEVEIA